METLSVTLELDPELKERVEKTLLDRVRHVVSVCADRDDLLRGYAEQADGLSQPLAVGPWKNSCQLDDPITEEHRIALSAYLEAALRNEPYWLVEAQSPDDEEAAAKLEQGLTAKARQWKLRERLWDVVWNATTYPFAILFASWRRDMAKRRYLAYVDPETGQDVEEAEIDPGKTYRQEPRVQAVPVYDGPDLRAVNPTDFYVYPVDCDDLDRALCIIERQYLTAEDLMDGVRHRGYDRDRVLELLRHGPSWIASETLRQNENERDGTDDQSVENGYFECYRVVGRFPLLFGDDKELETPEHLLDEDFMWEMCPDADIVFRSGPYPYPIRTYVPFHILRKPGRLMGKCVPSILEPLQEEATANLRFIINCMNLISSPVLKVPEKWLAKRAGWQAGPGMKLPYMQSADEIQVLQWDKGGIEVSKGTQADLRMRANELMSAQGTDNVQAQEPPTATQVTVVAQGAVNKRDLFLQTFQEGMERLGQVLTILWLQHMNPDGESLKSGNARIEVTPADLNRSFRFIAHANTDAANPQLRLQKTIAEIQQVRQSPLYARKVQAGDLSMEYHMMRRLLEEMGERDIEGWIGTEPGAVDPFVVLHTLMAGLQQAAQKGDMAAEQLLQAAQQAVQQMQSQQPAPSRPSATLPPLGGGPGSGVSVAPNPHDMMPVQVGPQGFAAAPLPVPAINGNGVS